VIARALKIQLELTRVVVVDVESLEVARFRSVGQRERHRQRDTRDPRHRAQVLAGAQQERRLQREPDVARIARELGVVQEFGNEPHLPVAHHGFRAPRASARQEVLATGEQFVRALELARFDEDVAAHRIDEAERGSTGQR